MLKRKKEPPERKASTLQESAEIPQRWWLPQEKVDRLYFYRDRRHNQGEPSVIRENLMCQLLEDQWVK